MQEHCAVFISSLWMYAIFADGATAGTLGTLYLAARVVYPLFYISNQKNFVTPWRRAAGFCHCVPASDSRAAREFY